MRLVDEYVEEYPLTVQDSPSHNGVRIVAAKLLLHRRMTQQQAGGEQAISWPGEGAARTAAIMLVMFVQECLTHGCKKVLGVGAQDFYEILASIIREGGVGREELMAELIEHDREGSATQLASSAQFARLWSEGEAQMQAVRDAMSDAGWSDDRMLPESARSACEAARDKRDITDSATPLYKRKIFMRLFRVRMVSMTIVAAYFLAAGRLQVSREATFVFGTTIHIASWPTDLRGASRFTQLPACSTALVVCFVTYRAYFYTSETHVNAACSCVHALLCVVSAGAWMSGGLLSILEIHSWWAVRTSLVVDGAAFLIAVLALRWLGPPPSYPPGNVPFPVAVLRACFSFAYAAWLTPANRLRTAAFADRLGWNRVTMNLGDLRKPDDEAVPAYGESEGVRSGVTGMTSTDESPPRTEPSAKHHAAARAEMRRRAVGREGAR